MFHTTSQMVTIMADAPKKINWLAFILEDNALSMGRVMAWVMFGVLIYMWLAPVAVPETLITGFYVLLSYNFGKKLTGPIGSIMQGAMQKSGGITEREKAMLIRDAKDEIKKEIGLEKKDTEDK